MNDAALFEKIKSGKYDDGDPVWDTISGGAKSLVAQMLDVHAENRISADQCLQNDWIVQQSAIVEALERGAELPKPQARAHSERRARTVSQMQSTRSMQKQAHQSVDNERGEVPAIVEALLTATKHSFTEGQGSAVAAEPSDDDRSNEADDGPDTSNHNSDLGDDMASYL